MRQIKPQSALLQTTPTQIGPEALLGVAAGIGFRLGDPRILVHEATVWEAIKKAPCSAPLPAPCLPKRQAEWLMMGHSVHDCPGAAPGDQVDWTCSVRLGSSTKTVSCAAIAEANAGDAPRARLATDHCLAARGAGGENPVGNALRVAPLQLVGPLGISASPMAGTGPIGTEWPHRQQWIPNRPGKVEEMALDGTHMGWPRALDRRFFQLALPNQWTGSSSWDLGTDYELRAVGPEGRGFTGRLPALEPRIMYTLRGALASNDMQADLQTVWFLPDHDLGLLWWTGTIPGEYFDDDNVAEILLAFQNAGDSIPAAQLLAFAERRRDLEDQDPRLHADTVLMPPRDRGWVWEVIVNASDHPRFGLLPNTYDETCARLSGSLTLLAEAGERMGSAEGRHQQLAAAEAALHDLPAAPSDERDWRAQFATGRPEALDDQIILDADLSGLVITGWHAKRVRFERCRFDASQWRDCRFEELAFVDCSFKSGHFEATHWQRSTLRRCELNEAEWQGGRAESLIFDACWLERFRATAGDWRQVSMTGCRGLGGALHDMRVDSLTLTETSLPDWHWLRLSADGLGLVKSHLERLQIEACELNKCSVVATSLAGSRWDRCQVRMGVFSAGSTIEGSLLADCLFQASSWNELAARGVAVEHCSFAAFTAQRLGALGSTWHQTVLDDANATHADFTGATFEQCSMKEIMLHGANLTKTRVNGCNLIKAKTAWALTSPRPTWSGNTEVGLLAVPRRTP